MRAPRLKIDVEDVRAINPKIIYRRGSGYGPRGPEANKPGFDSASTWTRAGIVYNMTELDADAPAPMPGSIGDLTGGLTIAGAIGASSLSARAYRGTSRNRCFALSHRDVDDVAVNNGRTTRTSRRSG